MLVKILLLGAAVVIAIPMTPGRAAMEPSNAAGEVSSAAKTCRDLGGKPNAEAMLTVDDVNGDGAEDWIVDYAKLVCAGATNPFCGTGGCSLQIFLWSGGSSRKLAFDEVPRGYKFVTSNGKRMMQVRFGGAVCNETNSRSCTKRYQIGTSKIVAKN